MKDEDKTKDQLLAELADLRQQVAFLEASQTQDKQAEAALKESEERFRLLVEDVRDYAIFMLDTSGRIVTWNAGAERILGYQEAEIIGQSCSCIFTPEDLRKGEDKKELQTATTEGRAEDERWHVRKDGTCFWASGVVTALWDETGTLKGFSKVMRDMTERKQAEEERTELLAREQEARHELEKTLLELHKSEARFRRLAESGVVGVISSDVNGNITEANDAFLQMVGYTREELHQGLLRWDEMTPPEYLHLDERAIRELKSSKVCTPFEKEYIRKDGSRVPIVLGAALLEEFRDNAVCFVLDITRRKWAESALQMAIHSARQYAAQLRGLTSASLAINSTLSLDEMLQLITEQAREIIGTHQAITSLSIDENWTQTINAVSFSDKYAAKQQYKETLDISGIYALVCQLQHPIRMTKAELEAHPAWREFGKEASSYAPMRGWLVAPLTGREGKNIGLIQLSDKYEGEFTESDEAIILQLGQMASVAIENSQLYRAAESAQEQLRRQLEFTNAITSSLGEGVYALDSKGCVTFLNPAAQQILGWTQEEMLGKNMHESIHFQRADSSYIPIEDCQILSVLQQGKTIRNELDVFTCKDGLVFPVSYTASPIDVDGLITGAVVVFQDITQRKQAEEEREQLLLREQAARTEAQEANRIKDEFLSTVSHELRTPLNAMLGWVQMLRSGKLNEATFARALEIIERNARSQNQLIEDLLDISRIISGKLRLQIRPVELTSVINAAIDSVRLAAEAKSIQLTCELDSSTGLVVGDSDRLQQVVWNLLSNAIKFTPKGRHVTVQLERINSHAEITVSDTGQGISPEFLPYIFDRFRQADSATTRSHGGLGLGLAIVRHLVELHGGTIHADSLGEGQGAIFKVKLPVTALRQQTRPQLQRSATDETGVPLDDSPQLNGLQILVVDDEVDARELLTTLLEQRGAFVTAAASVEEALKVIEQSTPDVLVSDIGMPGEDGYALIRKVRAREAHTGGRIPAAALTAYARSEDRRQALLAGFQTHLPKPVEPAELIAVVANLSGRTG